MDNFRPHRPTFFTSVVAIVLIILLYHFTLGKRR